MIFCHPRFEHETDFYETFPEVFSRQGENRRRGHVYYGWIHRFPPPTPGQNSRLKTMVWRDDHENVLMEWKNDWRGRWELVRVDVVAVRRWIDTHAPDEEDRAYPHRIVCPITQLPMRDPVLLAGDGHTYEREAILRWLAENPRSPMTGLALIEPGARAVFPNVTLRGMMMRN